MKTFAQNGAACERTRRVYGDNTDSFVQGAKMGDQLIGKRTFARAGGPRDADDQAFPALQIQFLQDGFRQRVVVFHQRDEPGGGADHAVQDLRNLNFLSIIHMILLNRRLWAYF